ncbi:MAG: hypothetical protein KAI95_04595 [Bacteroidales bacterium]|nr:hypothetical protein [Bacteroidales bacterium]
MNSKRIIHVFGVENIIIIEEWHKWRCIRPSPGIVGRSNAGHTCCASGPWVEFGQAWGFEEDLGPAMDRLGRDLGVTAILNKTMAVV